MEKLQILWVAHSYTKPHEGVKNHSHPYYHMIYVVSGTLRFVIEDKTYHLVSGDYLLIPRNTNHAYFNDKKETAEYMEIKFSLFQSAFDKQLSKKDIQVANRALVGTLFEQILKEYTVYGSHADSAVESYLLALLNILGEKERYQNKQEFRYFAAYDYSELTQNIIRYLENHYHEDVSLNSLAKALNRTPSHLCVAFKKDTQLTINDCLNTIRIRHAAELIVYSEYNLTQVSEECGFSSVSHFNRVFLKYTGITPGQCRRAYPAEALIRQDDETSVNNNFVYSVLAQKLILPKKAHKRDAVENK